MLKIPEDLKKGVRRLGDAGGRDGEEGKHRKGKRKLTLVQISVYVPQPHIDDSPSYTVYRYYHLVGTHISSVYYHES